MQSRSSRARIAVFAVLAVLASPAREARADEAAERCVAAAERAQVLREEGHLVESRVQFAACGAEVCPAVVRRECVRWLTDVDERAPSIIVSVKTSAGADVVGASVFLDGVALPTTSMGRAFAVNPGPHILRAQHADFSRPTQQQVVVREREKGRVLDLVLSNGEAVAPAAAPGRKVPWLTWTLASVAVLGGAGFGALWSSGMDKVSVLRDSCAPYCSRDQIDDVKPTLNAARVSLGIGIGAAVGAVLVYLLQPSAPAASAAPAATGPTPLGPLGAF